MFLTVRDIRIAKNGLHGTMPFIGDLGLSLRDIAQNLIRQVGIQADSIRCIRLTLQCLNGNKMKNMILAAAMSALTAFAELPENLEEVLFSMTCGTNYGAWMAMDGEIVFRRPFSVFGSAMFRSSIATNDTPPLHYSITMERRFYGKDSLSNVVESLKQTENTLQRRFNQKFSCEQGEGFAYHTKCIDIDGFGWDVSFLVRQLSDVDMECAYEAKAKFYNHLHKEGRFVSCEDFNEDKHKRRNGPEFRLRR